MITLVTLNTDIIFDFNTESSLRDWSIVDDVVMGGRSSSTISINKDGYGVFNGKVSTENFGGFASVRFACEGTSVSNATHIKVRLKGDGKNYQLRLKHSIKVGYAYKQEFSTSGKWQEVNIPLHSFYPTFRGRRLDMNNFEHTDIAEVCFLIANKKNESFELLIDKIELVKN